MIDLEAQISTRMDLNQLGANAMGVRPESGAQELDDLLCFHFGSVEDSDGVPRRVMWCANFATETVDITTSDGRTYLAVASREAVALGEDLDDIALSDGGRAFDFRIYGPDRADSYSCSYRPMGLGGGTVGLRRNHGNRESS